MTTPPTTASRVPTSGKRVFDVAVSAVLLVALALPFALVAILVALDLRGMPFFCQRRIGWNGKPFTIYKFRSMKKGSPPANPGDNAEVPFLYVPRHDPRITRLGRFLRRYSIDETPQLLNVLLGNMSLIGPRPFDVRDFEQGPFPYDGYGEWARKRHWARPGITGLWQVSGRNDTSFADLIALDLRYVMEWTPGLEFLIIRRTFRAVMGGRGVY
ncbi:sugar transferase [Inquilinus sp. Marseille-Q2685]|uniref:sugar transferase n=1 Tax=Inquilinus sp. Marseille-Q2685 TaxID=2866581 RepID=UPI001CE47E8A|nr:sugar transferase [Inquilinus sp. Marseille-Q2685]